MHQNRELKLFTGPMWALKTTRLQKAMVAYKNLGPCMALDYPFNTRRERKFKQGKHLIKPPSINSQWVGVFVDEIHLWSYLNSWPLWQEFFTDVIEKTDASIFFAGLQLDITLRHFPATTFASQIVNGNQEFCFSTKPCHYCKSLRGQFTFVTDMEEFKRDPLQDQIYAIACHPCTIKNPIRKTSSINTGRRRSRF